MLSLKHAQVAVASESYGTASAEPSSDDANDDDTSELGRAKLSFVPMRTSGATYYGVEPARPGEGDDNDGGYEAALALSEAA